MLGVEQQSPAEGGYVVVREVDDKQIRTLSVVMSALGSNEALSKADGVTRLGGQARRMLL